MIYRNIKQKKVVLPLTELQKRMYAAISLKQCDYSIKINIYVEEMINIPIMQKTLELLMHAQPALRTIFRLTPEHGPVQVVLSDTIVPFYTDGNKPVIDIAEEPWNMVWNEQHQTLELAYCHLVMDGWSMAVFWRQLLEGYQVLLNGGSWKPVIGKSLISYFNYLSNQSTKNEEDNFWKNAAPVRPCILGDKLRPLGNNYIAHQSAKDPNRALSTQLEKSILKICSELHVTSAVVYYAAWMVLISSITGSDEVNEGIVLSGRDKLSEWNDTIGMYIQNIVLFCKLPERFDDLCSEIRTFLENVYVQSPNAGAKSSESIDESRAETMFDTLVVVENYPFYLDKTGEESIKITKYDYMESASYPFTVLIRKGNNSEIRLMSSRPEYQGHLDMLLDTYIFLLEQIANGCMDISKLKVAKAESIKARWGRMVSITEQNTLNQKIYNACIKYGDQVAIVESQQEITYSDLLRRVLHVAAGLQLKGVHTGDAVGICMHRKIAQLISVYAVQLVGAVYVPFGEIPANRANNMIRQAEIKYMIGESEKKDWECKWLIFEDVESCDAVYSSVQIEGNSPSYILFTSGSTGFPKGCVISHQSIINRLSWNQKELDINSDMRQLYKTPVTFDVSLIEIFLIFFSGHTLYVLPDGKEKMPDSIIHMVSEQRISYIHFVPAMLRSLIEYAEEFGMGDKLRSLELIVCSGEILPFALIQRTKNLLLSEKCKMVNLYGPTEAAVDVSSYVCEENIDIVQTPIGKPIDNTGLVILDAHYRELPYGVEGELYILGINLGIGYINAPELTERSFIYIFDGKRAYRTGDLAYRLPDGDIVVTGRQDDQIKYNGIRIETGEIEYQIVQSGFVSDAVVFLKDNGGTEKLIACCCGDRKCEEDLRNYLEKVLPAGMLPGEYFFLTRFPVSEHGKISKKALIESYEQTVSAQTKEVTLSVIETELSEIWNRILESDIQYSICDHFFAVGGNSLMLIQMLIEIKRKWKVSIASADVYANPTLQGISNSIENTLNASEKDQRIKDHGYSARKGMFLTQMKEPLSTAYNMPLLLELHSGCALEQAVNAFVKVINRYDWLHKRFYMESDRLIAKVEKTNIETVDCITCNQEELSQLCREFVKPFKMNDRLFRVIGVICKPKEYLVVDFHHILCDQNVVHFLLSAWIDAMEYRNLPMVEFYEDEVSENYNTNNNNSTINSKKSKVESNLVLNDLTPIWNEKSGQLQSIEFDIMEQDYGRISEFCQNAGCSMFQMLYASFILFCSRLFDKEKIIIGTNTTADGPVYQHMQLKVLAVKADYKKDTTFIQFLKTVIEDLADAMTQNNEVMDNLFDIMFVREEAYFSEERFNSYVAHVSLLNRSVKVPLTLFYQDEGRRLHFHFVYDEGLFEEAAILGFAKSFCYLMEKLVQNSNNSVLSYPLMSPAEEDRLVRISTGKVMKYDMITAQELFVKNCLQDPGSIVIFEGQRAITKEQLLNRCSDIALYLKELLEIESLVGIMVSSGFDYVSAMMGVLMAGCTFIPLDINHPLSRNLMILRSCDAKVCITDQNVESKGIIFIHPESFCEGSKVFWRTSNNAYCIFTSGSTGSPKGCLIEQKNLTNYLTWASEFYCGNEKQCFAFFSSPSVDMTVTSTLLPLIYGHSIVIFPNSPDSIFQVINDKRVTILKATPSHLQLLHNCTVSAVIKKVIVGGEQLTTALALRLFDLFGPEVTVYNEYGPTEATVGCMIYQYRKEDTFTVVPIGTAIPNMSSCIYDSRGQICHPGVRGQLVLEGKSVIPGYLRNDVQTKEKFQLSSEGGWRYKTGDMARMLVNGTILFDGRKDKQYKLSGYRVELAEISSVAEQFTNINQSVALIDKGHLLLFCIPESGAILSELRLRRALYEKIPHYMMPSRIIIIFYLPILLVYFAQKCQYHFQNIP